MTTRTKKTPFPFQEADIAALQAGGNSGFVAVETGGGKTLEIVELMLRDRSLSTVLVIALQDTHIDEWHGTVQAQSDGEYGMRIIDGSAKGKEAYLDFELGMPGFYTMTPQLFTRWSDPTNDKGPGGMWHITPDLVVVDEAHMIGAAGTKGLEALHNLGAHGRIVMSATWFADHFENAWGLARWVYPERDGHGDVADKDYQRWIDWWCATKYDRFSPTKRKIVGERRPGEFVANLPTYVFHTKRGVCCEFHPITEENPYGGFGDGLAEPEPIRHEVPLAAGQQRAIQQMEDALLMWLKDEAENARAFVTKVPAVKAVRLRQLSLATPSYRAIPGDAEKETGPRYDIWFEPDCESPKYDLFEGLVHEYGGRQWVAVTSSRKWAEEVARRLTANGIPAEARTGGVAKAKRAEQKQRFIDGEFQVLVCQTEAVSTGVDGLQHATNLLFWFDRSLRQMTNVQLIGRLDRRGQTQQVEEHYAVSVGTIRDRKTGREIPWALDDGVMSRQVKRQLSTNKSLKKAHDKRVAEEKAAARAAARERSMR